jgi:hypothetical protein
LDVTLVLQLSNSCHIERTWKFYDNTDFATCRMRLPLGSSLFLTLIIDYEERQFR